MTKRILAALLAILLIFSVTAIAFAEDETEPSEPSAWKKFCEAIKQFFKNIFEKFVSYIRSPKSLVDNAAIWNACKEMGVILIEMLREIFDRYINLGGAVV